MWFFDDALATSAPAVASVDAPTVASDVWAPSLVIVEEATMIPTLSGEISTAPAAETEITFFDPPASTEVVGTASIDEWESAILSSEVMAPPQVLAASDSTIQDLIFSPEDISHLETPVVIDPVPDIVSVDESSVLWDALTEESTVTVASSSDETPAPMVSLEDPAIILGQTVKALERSEQALKEQAGKLEAQAQSYHDQAAALSQAEEDAKVQAERLHKKADELESTIQDISEQQKKFSN